MTPQCCHRYVTEQGTDPSHVGASVWSTKITVSGAHFLSYLTDAKTPTTWNTLTTWWPWAHSSQTYRHLRTDTTLFLTINQWTVHKLITQASDNTPHPPGLKKMLCWNPLGTLNFGGTWAICLLAWPCNKPSLFQTPTCCFAWTHCVPGAGTYADKGRGWVVSKPGEQAL